MHGPIRPGISQLEHEVPVRVFRGVPKATRLRRIGARTEKFDPCRRACRDVDKLYNRKHNASQRTHKPLKKNRWLVME